MTDHLHGNQGTPILITSAPSPQLPWPFTAKGPEQQNPLCFHAMEAEGENGAPSSTIDAVCHLAVLLIWLGDKRCNRTVADCIRALLQPPLCVCAAL